MVLFSAGALVPQQCVVRSFSGISVEGITSPVTEKSLPEGCQVFSKKNTPPPFDSLMCLGTERPHKMAKFIFKYCYIFHLMGGIEGKTYQFGNLILVYFL